MKYSPQRDGSSKDPQQQHSLQPGHTQLLFFVLLWSPLLRVGDWGMAFQEPPTPRAWGETALKGLPAPHYRCRRYGLPSLAGWWSGTRINFTALSRTFATSVCQTSSSKSVFKNKVKPSALLAQSSVCCNVRHSNQSSYYQGFQNVTLFFQSFAWWLSLVSESR